MHARTHVRHRQHALNFLGGEDVLWQPVADLWQLDLRRRVVEQEILPREPAKEHLQDREPL